MNWVWCNLPSRIPIIEWCIHEILKLPKFESLQVNYQYIMTCGGYFEQPDLVFVSSIPMQKEDHHAEFRTLFHEVRHFFQHQTQMFKFNYDAYQNPFKPGMTDEEQKLQRYLEYLNYPWELDAAEFSMETFRQFWKTPLADPFRPKSPTPIACSMPFSITQQQAEPSYLTFNPNM